MEMINERESINDGIIHESYSLRVGILRSSRTRGIKEHEQ